MRCCLSVFREASSSLPPQSRLSGLASNKPRGQLPEIGGLKYRHPALVYHIRIAHSESRLCVVPQSDTVSRCARGACNLRDKADSGSNDTVIEIPRRRGGKNPL